MTDIATLDSQDLFGMAAALPDHVENAAASKQESGRVARQGARRERCRVGNGRKRNCR